MGHSNMEVIYDESTIQQGNAPRRSQTNEQMAKKRRRTTQITSTYDRMEAKYNETIQQTRVY